MRNLSMLIPAYNEERTIGLVLKRALSQLDDVLAEIIVVDDASTDNTREIARRWASQDSRIRVLSLDRNLGKTAAISAAIQEATGEIIVFQDADLEYDPAEVREVIAPICEGVADVVYGSRFLVRRRARVLYFSHYVANKLLTLLSDTLTNRNMTDIETCYKAFRSGVIKPLALRSRGFGLEVEITAMICQTKARTYEVPISYYGRTYEEGKKIGLRDGVMAIWYILLFNCLARCSPSARRYVRSVNAFLDSLPQSHENVEAESRPVPPWAEELQRTG